MVLEEDIAVGAEAPEVLDSEARQVTVFALTADL